MAKPIEFKPPVHAQAVDSTERLQTALVEHSDALLSALRLLQQLHDTAVLDLLRGMVGAGDEIVRQATTVITQPETIRGMRNLLLAARAASSIDPNVLHALVDSLQQPAGSREPPSLFSLGRRMNSPEGRRGLAAAVTLLEALGSGVDPKQQ